MPTLLIQRGKGNKDYQEVGPEYPLQVEVRQTGDSTPLITSAPSPKPLDYGSYTITGTAGSLLSFADSGSPGTSIAMPQGAKSFRGVLETASVRVRMDGSPVTATEGELIDVGATVVLSIDEAHMAGAFIRTGGASGVLKGHFYDVDASAFEGGV